MSQTPRIPGRVMALDYGRAHTGVAVSDPTGTIARPLPDVDEAGSPEGLRTLAGLASSYGAALVIVGLPVTLAGERGRQAGETERFIDDLRKVLSVPLIPWDERFTSKMAAARGLGSAASAHSKAAAVLLEDYLGSAEYRKQRA